MQSLKDKNAVVTGGSKGIGKSVCLALANAGANIFILDINKEEGLKTVEELLKLNVEAYFFSINVSEENEWIDFVTSLKVKNKSIDILVNNAGITRDNILVRMKEDEWDDIINTNLSSVYKMSKAVLRGMIKKRSGRIISITSVVGAMGNAGQSNYAAAKAGIMGFTKSLAREVGVRGITVNAIAPGFIQTDMTDKLPEDQKVALASQIPMARLGTVDEIAQSVLFLASENGSYITAQTLHVNGGMYTV